MLRAALGIIAPALVGLIGHRLTGASDRAVQHVALPNTRQEVDCRGQRARYAAANEHEGKTAIVTLSVDNDAGEQASPLERETARGA